MPTAGFIYEQSIEDDRTRLQREYVRLTSHFQYSQESSSQFHHRRKPGYRIPRPAMIGTIQGWKQVQWLRCRSPRRALVAECEPVEIDSYLYRVQKGAARIQDDISIRSA
jgi:hypothetical protein